MRYGIKFGAKLPIGYATEAKRKEDTHATVTTTGFYSSEDGAKFIGMLEGLPGDFLSRAPEVIRPSSVENMLAIVRGNGDAEVFVNELQMSLLAKSHKAAAAGSPVYRDDILNIARVDIVGITIPDDAGFFILFSSGWRKGLLFDFSPIGPLRKPRDFNVESFLGQCFAHVMFQELFSVDEQTWSSMAAQDWFPFIHLGIPIIKQMASHAQNGWNIDELLPEIADKLRTTLLLIGDSWLVSPILDAHRELIKAARERYLAGDHVSATAILYPRIEGIMRSCALNDRVGNFKPGQLTANLTTRAPEARSSRCTYLPGRFREFLQNVYFANFDPNDPQPKLGRHTVAHGVARFEDFQLKASTVGFLTLLQLTLFLSTTSTK